MKPRRIVFHVMILIIGLEAAWVLRMQGHILWFWMVIAVSAVNIFKLLFDVLIKGRTKQQIAENIFHACAALALLFGGLPFLRLTILAFLLTVTSGIIANKVAKKAKIALTELTLPGEPVPIEEQVQPVVH